MVPSDGWKAHTQTIYLEHLDTMILLTRRVLAEGRSLACYLDCVYHLAKASEKRLDSCRIERDFAQGTGPEASGRPSTRACDSAPPATLEAPMTIAASVFGELELGTTDRSWDSRVLRSHS